MRKIKFSFFISVPLVKHMSGRQVDYEEKSPLHFAAANGLGEAAKMLVEAKATVQVKVSKNFLNHQA